MDGHVAGPQVPKHRVVEWIGDIVLDGFNCYGGAMHATAGDLTVTDRIDWPAWKKGGEGGRTPSGKLRYALGRVMVQLPAWSCMKLHLKWGQHSPTQPPARNPAQYTLGESLDVYLL